MINNLIKRSFLILFLFLIQNGLKAQITSSIYNFDQVYPNGLVRNNNGDFYFSVNEEIKKLSSNGVVSTIANLNDYPYELAIDGFDNIYYFSYNSNNDQSIQKVSPDGTTSTFLSGINYPQNLKFDNLGNFYFKDYNSGQRSIKKFTPDGQLIEVVTVEDYINSFALDYYGNLYYSSANSIQKVTTDGTVSTYATGNLYPFSMTFDALGNLYYIDGSNWPLTIKKVTPNGDSQVYLANDSNLNYTNNLVSDPNGILYYINDNNTRQLIRVSLPCVQPSTPTANDQSFEDAATVANLIAIGDNIKWYQTSTGGFSLLSSTNLNTTTYYVTQTVNDCESNRIPVIVTINKMGLSKYGQYTADASLKVTINGAINSTKFVNKYGKNTKNYYAGNGNLNYTIYNSSSSYVINETDFQNFINSTNLVSSGTHSASLLLNWSNYNALTNQGISIPNSGNQFSTQISGYFFAKETGNYLFTCEGDDAVDLFINDVNVANQYGSNGMSGLGTHTGSIYLVAGDRYTFRARMQENGGGEGLNVFWRRPSETSGWNIYTEELSSSN